MHEHLMAKLDLDHKDEKRGGGYRKLSNSDRHGSAHKVRGEKKGGDRDKSAGKPKKSKKPADRR